MYLPLEMHLLEHVLSALTSKESGGKYGTAAGLSYSMDNLGRIIGPLFFTSLFKIDISLSYIMSIIVAIMCNRINRLV